MIDLGISDRNLFMADTCIICCSKSLSVFNATLFAFDNNCGLSDDLKYKFDETSSKDGSTSK